MPFVSRVQFAPNRKEALRDYLSYEITQALSSRNELERKWEDALLQWRASLPLGEVDFPWPGASNIEFPLTAIHSDPVLADMLQTLHAPQDYWNPVAKRPDRTAHASPLREFMTAVDHEFLKMRRVNTRALLDQNILGTAIYKTHWRETNRSFFRSSFSRGRPEKITRHQSRPVIEHVPLQHFLIPPDSWDIDPDAPVGGAAWVAQKFYLTPAQLKERRDAEDGYDRETTDFVMAFVSNPEDNQDKVIRDSDQYRPPRIEKIELYEVYVRFDVDNDGVQEDIVCIFHQPTATILRAIYTPFFHGKRPFHVTRYLPGFGFYGMGLGEIDQWAQEVMSKLLNATLDNTLIANTIMISAPRGSMIAPNEPIYPGKVWFTDPGERVEGIHLGQLNPYLIHIIGFISQYADLRTGISEVRQGDISSLPGRTPATTIMSMLHESNKRFDMILSNLRDTHGEMGLRTLQNIAQEYKENPVYWQNFCLQALGEQDAALVLEVLQDEVDDVEASFGISISATSALVNKEAEKQSFIGMLQTIIPMYQQLVQTAALMMQAPPGSPMQVTAAASYSAGVDLIARLLERFDVQNPSQYLGQLQTVAAQLTQSVQPGMMSGVGTPGMSAPGVASQFAPYPGAPVPSLGPAQVGSLFGL